MPSRKRASGRGNSPFSDAGASLLEATPWALHLPTADRLAVAMRRHLLSGDLTTQAAAPAPVEASVRGQRQRTAGAVAVLPLRGVITPRASYYSFLFGGGGGLESFREALRDLVADDDIAAIVIDVDSPGGSTSLVPEVAAEIRALRGAKPIVAIANTFAASAAYWLAAQCDELVVSPSAQVGSIGTYMRHFDWSKYNAELGVDPTYVFAGRFKVEGNEDEPLGDEAEAELQRTVDEFQAMFVADVALGRGVSEETVATEYGEGRVFTARRAVEAGLADRVATLDEVVAGLLAQEPPGVINALAEGVPTVVVLTGADGAQTKATLTLPAAPAATPPVTPAPEDPEVPAAPEAAVEPAGDSTASSQPPASREEAAVVPPPWLLIPSRH